ISTDGKAMRLVAELLDAIEDGIARLEQQRFAPLQIDAFAPGVAVVTFGYRRDLDLGKSELVEHACGRGKLPGAAVDQYEIGRGPAIGGILVPRELAEAPCQHFPHHGVI